MSQDFYSTIPPVDNKSKWFECYHCHSDLRACKHKVDCGLSPADQSLQIGRVSFIIAQMFKNKGLSVLNGGKNDDTHTEEKG